MVRGEVFELRAPRTAHRREQGDKRYGVVVQGDELLALNSVVICPTSTTARAATFRPTIEVDGRQTRVMIDQTRAVDISALQKSVGRLSAVEALRVDQALALILGL